MKAEQIVVNTLVFESLLNNEVSQHELFGRLSSLGVKNVEIRREFIRSAQEFEQIDREAKKWGLGIFYSIPDCLFSGGNLQSDKLANYLEEAQRINARMVKFTKGDFAGWNQGDVAQFKSAANAFSGLITVENDQTERDGKMKALIPFYRECLEKDIPVFATFDIGNGCWTGDHPLKSAGLVKDLARFVHLKDVKMTEHGPQAVFLGEGIVAWKEIMTEFDSSIYAAIEYPCGDKPYERLEEEFNKLKNYSSTLT